MADSMLSNVEVTLKEVIPVSLLAGGTFTIFETGIVTTGSSFVFASKTQIERWVVDIATDGVVTVVKRGLDNSQTKTEVEALRKEWGVGSKGYITVLASDILDVDSTDGLTIIGSDILFTGDQTFEGNVVVNGSFQVDGNSIPSPVVINEAARDALYPNPVNNSSAYVINLNGEQKYNEGTAQWELPAGGTPAPDANETVKGLVQLATDAEFDNGVETGTTGAKLVATPKQIKGRTSSLLRQVVLGEDVVAGDGLGAVYLGTSQDVSNTGGATTFNFGNLDDTSSVSLWFSLTYYTLTKLELDINTVGSPTDDIIATFTGINNANKTVTIPFADISSTVDIAQKYFDTHNEFPTGSEMGVTFRRDGALDAVNYYTVTTTAVTTGSYTIPDKSGVPTPEGPELEIGTYVVATTIDSYKLEADLVSNNVIGVFRIYVNGVLKYTSPDVASGNSPLPVEIYEFGVLVAGDELSFTVQNTEDTSTTYIIENMIMYTKDYTINSEITDGGDSALLSDIRFSNSNRCDGIILESGLAGETVTMVTAGNLGQTTAVKQALYYLNNVDGTDKGSFNTTAPTLYTPFLIGQGKTDVGVELMINEQNYSNLSSMLPTVPIPGTTNTYFEANTTQYTNSTTYTKVKEVLINDMGEYTISFDLSGNGSTTGYGRIYVNGVPVGIERSVYNTAGFSTFVEDIIVNKGDLIQIYFRSSSGTQIGVRNFNGKFDVGATAMGPVIIN